MATKHKVEDQIENGLKISANYQPSGGKTWMAEIKGEDSKYGLDREFVSETNKERSGSGKTGQNFYHAEEGKVYEMNVAWGNRFFFTVEDGEIVYLDDEKEVLDKLGKKVAA